MKTAEQPRPGRNPVRPGHRGRRTLKAGQGNPMRAALWLLALFGVAVRQPCLPANNQGTVTLFWPPTGSTSPEHMVVLRSPWVLPRQDAAAARPGSPAGTAPPGPALARCGSRKERAIMHGAARCSGPVVGHRFCAHARAALAALEQESTAARQRRCTPRQPTARPWRTWWRQTSHALQDRNPTRTPPEPGAGPRCRAPQHAGPELREGRTCAQHAGP